MNAMNNNTNNNTIIIAISTDENKVIRSRIHVFNSVLLGNKKPGDLIRRGNHELKIYGVIRNDCARFDIGVAGWYYYRHEIVEYHRTTNAWICNDTHNDCYPYSIKDTELISISKNDIECIYRTGMTVLESQANICAGLAIE